MPNPFTIITQEKQLFDFSSKFSFINGSNTYSVNYINIYTYDYVMTLYYIHIIFIFAKHFQTWIQSVWGGSPLLYGSSSVELTCPNIIPFKWWFVAGLVQISPDLCKNIIRASKTHWRKKKVGSHESLLQTEEILHHLGCIKLYKTL